MSAPSPTELTVLNVRLYRPQLPIGCTNEVSLVNREYLLAAMAAGTQPSFPFVLALVHCYLEWRG